MIKKSVLGSTGIAVSAVGLGTVKFGRNQQVHFPEPFDLPSDQQVLTLLSCAQTLGINLLDTAPAYGNSEERLGQLLRGQRQDWVLSTKVGEEFVEGRSEFCFSADSIRNSVQRSLQRLNTDYLDIVLVHSNGDDQKIIEENPVFETLDELKQAGLIRAFGMSTKTVVGGKLAVERSDVVMVTYNLAHTEEQPVIAHAHHHNKGIFIKKALASGHLQKLAATDPVRAAMQFVFQEPGVSSVILGTLNPQHLTYNVECAS